VVLSQEVTNEIQPGEYRCEGVTVYDVHLNRKTFHPDIRFRVVNMGRSRAAGAVWLAG
jgi:hypothetical protein